MKLYIDADACPQLIKQIVFKAAIRTGYHLILVAHQFILIPEHPLIKAVRVTSGADVADDYIVEHVIAGDLVVTADIPLADRVITKGAVALNPRGMFYTKENIKERLSVRDFLHDARASGINTGGPKPLTQQDIRKFANALDRYLAKMNSR